MPTGGFAVLDGEAHYRIASYQRMSPFLVSLASDTDLWMFIASGGGLTAGRVDADGSLFPYRTVDQLHDAHHHTGPLTLVRVEAADGGHVLWEPFAARGDEDPAIERSLAKNTVGNRIVFEEVNHALGLSFRYRWAGCDAFGWVRTAVLENRRGEPVKAAVLDGLRNVLPCGAPLSLYQQSSNLVDAYKKNEVDAATGLGIFSLTAGITDRAEALEILRANTVWSCGLDGARVHLSLAAAEAFRHGRVVRSETVRNGGRGHYLVSACIDLEAGQTARWHLAGDVGRDHLQIAALRRGILSGDDMVARIDASLQASGDNLRRIVGSADGLQLTGRSESWSHHFANVLFNTMRGGVFARNHDVTVADFAAFLETRNRDVARRNRSALAGWPGSMAAGELRQAARDTGDADLERLGREYLPLYFGRRHGDPSRPWNRFSIRVQDRNGERVLNYEGNWRDIFQNWEALGASFPDFLPHMVARFVNASTVDGFNPYRITRDGVDWETVEPDDPWSNIGYWGDHQIVYLLRLLEAWDGHDPSAPASMLGSEIFSYAEVPYLIKPYAEILRDPGATIDYDVARAARIDERTAARGSDGKLLTDADGTVRRVNLLEKLLVPALSKLSNLIPDAGIWMNTQRPEWNDANNALGGGGVSVVTLCHLRRHLAFLADRLEGAADRELPVSSEVVDWFERIEGILDDGRDALAAPRFSARDRRRFMDALGEAFSTYRTAVYAGGFSGRRALPVRRVAAMFRTALAYIDHGLAANRRDDGLVHTYNLLEFSADGVEVVHLQEMLEGQVAILGSGVLDPEEALEIVERLFGSALYREDQRSFMLYPERDRPGFLARNTVPDAGVEGVGLLTDLLAAGNHDLVARDADGVCRFHGDVRNADDVAAVLDGLAANPTWRDAVARDRAAVVDLFETVFDHRSYTGRSGVMYGYEGLGCIYWHMVAKLLLAIQENVRRAVRDGAPAAVRDGLSRMYFRVRAGIGYEKTVAEYGAFPTDPYSHTPPGGGAKQPGMTGQVKEEILTRLGELGVRVEAGTVRFEPTLLRAGEFLDAAGRFSCFDVQGRALSIDVPAGGLAFTHCQVPVVYRRVTNAARIRVIQADGTMWEDAGAALDARRSADLLSRNGRIARIEVDIPDGALLGG